jgi:hypothetical protein
MKKQFKKWTFRLIFTGLFLFGLLLMFMLCPILLYANKTIFGTYSIYHNKPLNKNFLLRLGQAGSLIKSSDLYDPELKIDICLKDGSAYPGIIERVLGRDMLSSFYNKLVFTCDAASFDSNYITLYGHKWNLTAMLAHGQVHCMEFKKYGFWKSNPLGKHPVWKWEGYPEYIARKGSLAMDLWNGISRMLETEQVNHTGWMRLPDGTETLTTYFRYLLLVQYCLEIKKMSFARLLEDRVPEDAVRQEMLGWYNNQINDPAIISPI